MNYDFHGYLLPLVPMDTVADLKRKKIFYNLQQIILYLILLLLRKLIYLFFDSSFELVRW